MLSDAQAQYVRSFLRHRNVHRALRESGVAPGQHTMPEVSDAIADAEAAAARRYVASVDNVISELAKIAFFNIGKLMVEGSNGEIYPDFSYLEPGDAAAISEMTVDTYMDGPPDMAREVKRVKVKLHPKTPALQLLGNTLRMWQDRHEHTVSDDIVERMREARAAITAK